MFPINMEFNKEYNELCILTKSDLRIVDIYTG
jgi:hypothetical protein